MSQPSGHGLRLNVAVGLLLCAFVSSALGSTDPLAIFICVVCLLSASVVLGWRRLITGLEGRPWFTAGLLVLIALLLLNYAFSWSRQSSFTVILAIALLPIGFLLGSALADQRRHLFLGIGIVIVLLASVSAVRLLVLQERAMLPLEDPNNFATLLYLVAIPGVHYFLRAQWSGDCWSRGWQVGFLVAFGLVATALFGTQSRTGLLILACGFGYWLMLAARCGYSFRPLLALTGVAIAAYWLSRLGIPLEIAGRFSAAELSSGFEVRLALIDAALDMGSDHPFFGIGVFVFPLLYRTVRDENDPVTAGYFVHNDYIQLFAEGGLLLAFLFVCLATYVWVRAIKVLFFPKQTALLMSTGIGLGLAAAFAHAIVNFVFYVAPLALLLGFLLAAYVPVAAKPTVASRGCAGVALGAYFLAGLLAISLLAVDVSTEVVLQGRLASFVDSGSRTVEQQYEFANAVGRLSPDRGVPALASAVFAERMWDADSSHTEELGALLTGYRVAIAADPWNPNAIFMLKQFTERRPEVVPLLARSESAEALLWRCLTVDPMFAPALQELAVLLGEQGRGGEFKDFLRVQLEPKLAIMHRENPAAAWMFHGILLEDAKQLSSTSRIARLEFLEQVMSNEVSAANTPRTSGSS